MDRLRRYSTAPLRVRLSQLLYEDPIAEETKKMAQRTARKELQREKIERYNRLKSEQATINLQMQAYLSDVRNVIQQRPEFRTRHPAVYKYLGTSRAQLQNSYLVAEDVAKFLKKGKVAQACLLVRLAGSTGTVGMNHILKHLTQTNKHKLAVALHSKMKKWGVGENVFSRISLQRSIPRSDQSSGSARPLIKGLTAEKILETHRKNKAKLGNGDTVVNDNYTLKLLASTGDDAATAEFYRGLGSRDAVTYSTLLSSPCRSGDEVHRLKQTVWAEVQGRVDKKSAFNLDQRLVLSYAYMLRNDNDETAQAFAVLQQYFELPEFLHGQGQFAISSGADLDILLSVLDGLAGSFQLVIDTAKHFSSSISLDSSHLKYLARATKRSGDRANVEWFLDNQKLLKEKPSSSILAEFMRTFQHAQNFDPILVERLKRLAQTTWGKKLHIDLLESYVTTYAHVYGHNSNVHPRHGLRALHDASLSHHVIAVNLSNGRNVDLCKQAIQSIVKLSALIYKHPQWLKHRFVWVDKMHDMYAEFERDHLNSPEGSLDPKALEQLILSLDTIVKRGQGSK